MSKNQYKTIVMTPIKSTLTQNLKDKHEIFKN
jgi:hypothetical protein